MSEEYWETLVKDLNVKINHLEYVVNMKQEEIDKLVNYIEQIRKMLYKRHLDDYDVYTANVLCDMQSDFEEILRGEY